MIKTSVVMLSAFVSGVALATPASYTIDSNHTYPSFETDHKGGLSIWRGKFDKTTGSVQLDAAAKTGSIDITIDTTTINFGLERMNTHVKSADMLDVEKFPTATYKGTFSKFNANGPTEVQGDLTLHGVTKPVTLTINSFVCRQDAMTKKEVCGADASGTFNRADFGVNFGQQGGFKMDVKLAIQVEAKAN